MPDPVGPRRGARPPVARALRAALDALAAALPTAMTTAYRAAATARGTTAAAVAARCGLSAEERDVHGIPVTVFRGRAAQPAARVVFLHGGGLIAGDRFDGADVVGRHAGALDLEIWSVEYPLAPEHTFTAMVDAALTVAAAAGADGTRVLLAGQSAGGGIAAAAAWDAASHGVRIDGQLLVCPMLARADPAATAAFRDDPSWSAQNSTSAWQAALDGDAALPAGERRDPPALPPAYLDAGSAELFRDAITAYATALWRGGNRAELHVWSGGFHAFDCAAEEAVVSAESHRVRGDWIRRWLDGEV
ncbi:MULTISPECIES: alpha/beta hydrolase [Microbacterium]|nr:MULTISPECIES: alpha/beta hydrolase fold domain-containing protein [Microbacterium]